MRVSFAPGFPDRDRSRIDAVLRRIAVGTGDGRWERPPDAIEVVRQLGGGRSGALVLSTVALRGGHRYRHVVKVDTLAEARAEWTAFRRAFKDVPSVLCTPIVAVSSGVLDPGQAGEDEAVVYVDVAQFTGSDAEPVSLEEVVTAAVAGGECAAAVAALRVLVGRARQVLYDREVELVDRDMLAEKPALGPDLRIRVTRVGAEGQPSYDDPPGAVRRRRHRYPRDVVIAGLRPDGADGVAAGDDIGLTSLTVVRDGGRLLGIRDDAVVEIVAEPGSPAERELTDLDAGAVSSVWGRVASTRTAATWQRLTAALPGLARAGAGAVRLGRTTAADPFAALWRVLREPVAGRALAYVHGDLNPRNVLLVEDDPFLIDYPRVGARRPVLTDLAWLELNLLRAPLAGGLGFAELVHVLRVLALGDRVAELLPDADRLRALLVELVSGSGRPAVTAVRVLGALREQARSVYPAKAGPPCWSEHQVMVLLAAHRAVKWGDDLQTEQAWRAQLALACVATEALSGDPYGWWAGRELEAAAAGVLPLFGAGAPTGPAAELLGELVPRLSGRLPGALREARAAVSTGALGPAATARWRDLRPGHDVAIDLTAEPVLGAAERRSAVSYVLDLPAVVLVGPSGGGRTATLDEVEYRLLERRGRLPARADLRDWSPGGLADLVSAALDRITAAVRPAALLAAGAVHLLLDHAEAVSDPAALAADLAEFRRRFPAVPVAVTLRGRSGWPALDGWPTVRLQPPDARQAVDYLVARSRRAGTSIALGGGLANLLDRGGCLPLLLARAADLGGGGRAATEADLLDDYVDAVLSPEQAARLASYAATMTDGADPGADRPGAEAANAGFLDERGFRHQLEQDYFAARWLRDQDGPTRSGLARRHRWYAAFRTYAAFGTSARTVGAVLDVVADADPVQAARLLRAPAAPPADLAMPLLVRQAARLRDGGLGHAEHSEAAAALAAFGAPVSYGLLLEVLTDDAAPLRARVEVLGALGAAATDEPDPTALVSRLEPALARLLEEDAPAELTTLALAVVGRLRLRGLALLLADLIGADRSGPVRLAAVEALDALGLPIGQRMAAELDAARLAELAAVEAALPTVPPERAGPLQRDRIRLLRGLRGPDRLDQLRDRRYRYEIGPVVAAMLASAPPAAGSVDAADFRATGMAMDRLLRDDPDEALALLVDPNRLPHRSMAERAALAAAVVPRLPVGRLAPLRGLAVTAGADLAGELAADLDGLASLGRELLLADRATGLPLVREIHRSLTDRGQPARLRWPWAAVVLLAAADPRSTTDIDTLAGRNLLGAVAPGPGREAPDPVARQRLLDQLAGTADLGRLSAAAAALDLSEALPRLLRHLTGPRDGPPAEVGTAGGVVELAPTAEVLAAAGYLARIAAADDPAAAAAVRSVLDRFPVENSQPGVTTGRLAGLAYLGDWPTVLAAVPGDPRLDHVARNLLEHWLPGPATPPGPVPHASVAAWIADRMRADDLTPEARSVLLTLRRRAERTSGEVAG